MKRFQKDMIGIVKAALLNEKYSLSEDFDLDSALQLAKKHGIVVMFYYGLLNCGVDESLPIMQNLFMLTCHNVAVSERQMYAVNEIFSAFDEAEIDYMPLKGTVLKSLYRKPEMRLMGDADVLIKVKQYNQIKSIMQKLGFDAYLENDHELSWKKTSLYIELHKRLMPSYNKDYFLYYGDGWRLAKIKDGTRYSMTDEDQMIYLFTHYAKHYRDAGIGIRHIVDLWVYRKNKQDLDEDYIKNELSKLGLYNFYVNTIRTLLVWFEENEEDDVTDFITNVIFSSGVYGTRDAHNSWETIKISKQNDSIGEIKKRKIFRTIFLPYQYMCIVFPVLKKAPFLLPIMWIVRCIRALLFRRDSIHKNIDNLNVYDLDKAEEHKKALNYVGIDFNFKE